MDGPAVHLTRRGRLLVAITVALTLGAGGWAVADRAGMLDATTGTTVRDEPTVATPDPTVVPSPTPALPVAVAAVESGGAHLGVDPAAAQVAAIAALLDRAPVMVVAAANAVVPARGVAWRLRAPLVPADAAGLADLLDRVDATTVVVVARPPPADETGPPPGDETGPPTADETGSPTADETGPPTAAPTSTPTVTLPDLGDRDVRTVTVTGTQVDRDAITDLLSDGQAAVAGPGPPLLVADPNDLAYPLLGTLARATGARLVPVTGDLAQDTAASHVIRSARQAPWMVVGTDDLWPAERQELFEWDAAVVAAGHELPGGGLRLLPGRRFVALYGSPGSSALGVLGEQDADAAVARARELAAEYEPLDDVAVIPTFEIISTIATAGAGDEGDYSRRVPHDEILPWIEAAGAADMYVILDLQPGRTDFLTQAQELEPLLRHPHVGLALDPEWRLKPDQTHLVQIGSVAVEEVQAVADWLAELTRRHALPQKVFLLHQFRMSMLPDRDQLALPPELATIVQMDGQGPQPSKLETWAAVTAVGPDGIWFGWKNFYDEDPTLRSPADTLAVPGPTPILVSYQ